MSSRTYNVNYYIRYVVLWRRIENAGQIELKGLQIIVDPSWVGIYFCYFRWYLMHMHTTWHIYVFLA
jgi:hypothetical protein